MYSALSSEKIGCPVYEVLLESQYGIQHNIY